MRTTTKRKLWLAFWALQALLWFGVAAYRTWDGTGAAWLWVVPVLFIAVAVVHAALMRQKSGDTRS